MLNQEFALMRQGDELHQFYRVKIDMMEDSPWKRFDGYNLHKGGFQFIPENKCCLAQCLVFMQKPIDLQLSADEFISHYVDDYTGKEPTTVSLKNFSQDITVSDVDKINLSLGLSIGHSKDKDNKSSDRNKSCASSEFIDLEDPNFGVPKNNTSHEFSSRFPAAKSSSEDEHKLGSFLQIGMNHISYGSPARESVSGVGPSCQRPPASYSGCVGHHSEFSDADRFSKNQTSETCKARDLDLNMVQFEYSSYFTNNSSMVQNPSRTSFSGVTEKVHTSSSSLTWWNQSNVIDLSESSDKHRQLDLNIDLTNSYEDNNEGGWNKVDKFRTADSGGVCVIDLDSDSGEPCTSNKSYPKIESVDSSSKSFYNLACKSSDNTESNIQYVNNEKLEMDEMAQKAAESLVKISSETRVCHHHGSENVLTDKDKQPQCSSDSYEKMVLWAKERDLDDFCVSSNAFVVVDESDNKVSSYKLKRGTRMKDFQKDVLPSLSILSKHEINEDIKIMEGVIRSREYKRMWVKMQDDGEWFKSRRCKRSKAGYNRRYYQ